MTLQEFIDKLQKIAEEGKEYYDVPGVIRVDINDTWKEILIRKIAE